MSGAESTLEQIKPLIVEAMKLLLMTPGSPFESWAEVTKEGKPYFLLNRALTLIEEALTS